MRNPFDEQPLTITRLEVENIKRIKVVKMTPEGGLVIVGGQNDQGKSSLTDAIRMLLGGEKMVPDTAVRHGESDAHVIGHLGDELIVERHFVAGGKSTLVVKDTDGRKMSSPQTILNKLYTALSFDPLAFAAEKNLQRQAKMLQDALGLDFTDVDHRRKTAYDERTIAHRFERDTEGRLRGMIFHLDAPKDEVSTAELVAKASAVEAHKAKRARAEEAVKRAQSDVDRIKLELERAEDTLRLRKQDFDAIPEPESLDVSAELQGLEAVNRKVRENKAHADVKDQLQGAREEVARLDRLIEECDAEKADAIASAQFPVDGLSFRSEDGAILLNGFPLDQAAESQRIRLSVAIGFAMNPRLKVLLVRQGSELDSRALRLLAELAAEHEGQVWIERVSEDGVGCSVVLEDGAIKEAKAAE